MNGNMNLGKRVTVLEKDGGADIKKEISDLQNAVTEMQTSISTAQEEISNLENKVNSGHVYSTEEKVVGTWINGKPIYQRNIVLDNPILFASNTWVIIDNSSFYDLAISLYAIDSNLSSAYPFITNTENNTLRGMHTRNIQISIKEVVVQYTKTTDNPTQ